MENNFEIKQNIFYRAEDLLDKMNGFFSAGENFPLVVSGNSMSPFLFDKRDSVLLSCPNREIKPGDICLYYRNTRLILHRVVKKIGKDLYFCGDAQEQLEGPISSDEVIAVVISVFREKKTVKADSIVWKYYKNRAALRRLYKKIK